MDWQKEPTLAEFKKTLDLYVEDIMNIDDPDAYIYSHRIVGGVRVQIDDDNDDTDYEIVGLDLDQLGGCGCSAGVIIRIKKCNND